MSQKKNLMVIDCDAGVDDAQALMVALSNPDTEVLAITCVRGNVGVDQVWYNVHRVLDACDRREVPVYKGATRSLVTEIPISDFHGIDGLGDVPPHPDFTINSSHQRSEHAVDILISLANQYPGLISLVAIAPLTNLALAEKMAPGFSAKLKGVFIMGGNMYGKGNANPCGEYNFYQDPDAAYIVLDSYKCPITMVTWELTMATEVPFKWIDGLMERQTKKGRFLKAISEHSYKIMSDEQLKVDYFCIDTKGWNCCDALAVCIAIDPSIITDSKQCPCSVSLEGVTRGQMIVDWHTIWRDKTKRTVVQSINMDRYKELLVSSVE
ncbi:inosine-uridine preferring nucleoside hydrolase-like [Patiria miniata]|uniref:Inosine/uridine-preferring nucleoside hydrolase domain-containing protein n=1 Tax=Patiria miniata TaxID=46514 RepID=A0A914ACL0_PATMI|nr:inosine-uridine preferring nucleoside hydrolase-like [Patiria miniata]XP_038061202.1 inosine-uridine preferring nucleoside hydrolase-like [Patiria miniata]